MTQAAAVGPTQAELAHALGVHPSVVTRDKAKGMPTDDVAAAQAWRRANVRPRVNAAPERPAGAPVTMRIPHAQPSAASAGQGGGGAAGRDGGGSAGGGGAGGGGAAAAGAGAAPDVGADYWVSRARREQAEAELAELKLAEQQGHLVRAAAVRASIAKRAAGLREALLQLPARLVPVLAADPTPAAMDKALRAEIVAALQHLAEAD